MSDIQYNKCNMLQILMWVIKLYGKLDKKVQL